MKLIHTYIKLHSMRLGTRYQHKIPYETATFFLQCLGNIIPIIFIYHEFDDLIINK